MAVTTNPLPNAAYDYYFRYNTPEYVWESSARSAQVMPAEEEGYFRFVVPVGTLGLQVCLVEKDVLDTAEALDPDGPRPTTPHQEHSVHFSTYFPQGIGASPQGKFEVGDKPTEAYEGGTAFYFCRFLKIIGGFDHWVVAIGKGPATLPAPVEWVGGNGSQSPPASYPSIPGEVVLHARMRSPGDSVESAAFSSSRLSLFGGNVADAVFPSMEVEAIQGNFMYLAFEYMEVTQEKPAPATSLDLALGPVVLVASQAATHNFAAVDLLPIKVDGSNFALQNSADVSLPPLAARITGGPVLAATPGIPGIPPTPDSPPFSGVPGTPGAPDVPGTAGTPEDPEVYGSEAYIYIALPTLAVDASNELIVGMDLRLQPLTVQGELTRRPPYNAIDTGTLPLEVQARECDSMCVLDLPPITLKIHERDGIAADVVLPRFAGVAPPVGMVVGSGMLLGAVAYPSSYTLADQGMVLGADAFPLHSASRTATSGMRLGASAFTGSVVDAEGAAMLLQAEVLVRTDAAVTSALLLGALCVPQSETSALLTSAMRMAGAVSFDHLWDADAGMVIGASAVLGTFADLTGAMRIGCDAEAGAVHALPLLESAMVLGGQVVLQTQSSLAVDAPMRLGADVVMKTPGLVAWVMNADTGGVSWYDNWAFTSMAVVDGRVFASGPDGLVLLGGDSDGADTIDARVEYGLTEFGGYDKGGQPKESQGKKRVPALWFGYTAQGALAAEVETYGQGLPAYTYAMPPRSANQPRNNRIQPGKGLNARYWRIGVSNVSGCDFEVHSLAAEVAASNRRL